MKRIFIPNSQYFSAIPTGNNQFMEIFDITSKEHEILNILDPRIARANKYLKRQYARLNKYARKTNARGFTVVAMVLLKRSTAFRLAATCFKWPKWYQMRTGSQSKNIFRAVKGLAERLETKIEYKRVWIPKGDDPYGRPLGCPTVPWRIYLWMFYYFIDIWTSFNKGRAPWQHGGFSRKGPNTFFDQLIGEGIYRKKYIYEFDLKGYFNNITHKSILEALEATKIPQFLMDHASQILRSRPTKYGKMPAEYLKEARNQFGVDPNTKEIYATQNRWDLLVKEEEEMSDVELYNAINHPKPPEKQQIKHIVIEVELTDGTKHELMIDSEGRVIEIPQEPWEGPAHDWIHGLRQSKVGTPQGASSSPLLTSLASSHHCGIHNPNLMMYVDDGIIAADSRRELDAAIQNFEEAAGRMGVSIAEKKSGMVKDNGIWLKDLKIIGFRIDRFLDWVFSSTRSGTEIPMPLPNYEQLREYHSSSKIPSFTEEDKKDLIEAFDKLDSLPEGSRARFIEWIERIFAHSIEELRRYVNSEDFDPNDPTHVIMSKTGNTGKVMAKIWNPVQDEIKRKIDEGIHLSLLSLRKNPNSYIMDRMGPHKIEQIISIGPKALQTISTEMSNEYLNWEARKKENLRRPTQKKSGTIYSLAGIRKPGWK